MLIYLLLVATTLPCFTDCKSPETEIFLKLLKDNPDVKLSRAPGLNGTGPTVINVSIYVRKIKEINTRKMEMSVEITLRLQWRDLCLNFGAHDQRGTTSGIKYITVPQSMMEDLWFPDIFISNSLKTDVMTSVFPDAYRRIFSDGSVLSSTRMALKLSCPMNLKKFPFDTQICSMRLASYGHTTDDIAFLWKDGDPVQVAKNIHLPGFTLEKFLTAYCNSRTNTGEYSCIKTEFMFYRESGLRLAYMLESIAIISTSWFVFWFTSSPASCRVMYLLFCAFLESFIIYKTIEARPPVSYHMPLDTWNWICAVTMYLEILFLMKIINGSSEVIESNRDAEETDKEKVTPSLASRIKDRLRITNLLSAVLFPILYYSTIALYFFSNI